MFEKEIRSCLKKTLKEEIILEVPPNPELGDYAYPCFQLAKKLKKSPVEIAKDISAKIKFPSIVKKVIPNGPYLNFYLNNSKVANAVVSKIINEKYDFGKSDAGKGKTIVIDYSSPNIGKPFHVGHLRSTIIGNSLKLMHQFLNFKVVGVNHLGDWGTQFGKLIYAHLQWGKPELLKINSTKYLLDLYVRFNREQQLKPDLQDEARKWFKNLEDGDKKAIELWTKFKSESLKEFNRIYDLLFVNFDSYAGESFYNDKMKSALSFIKRKGILEKSEGALVIDFNKKTPPLILIKSDGATTYGLRDLTALKFRIKTYKPQKILYVVGSEQNLHFQQLFTAAKKLDWKVGLEHVSFGLYLDKSGKKFATRKGEILLLNEVISSTINKAFNIIQEKNPLLNDKKRVAHLVGVGAIIFGDLMNDRVKDAVFDWDKILDFEGDTGPYLQYSHARACSILRKCFYAEFNMKKFDSSVLTSQSEIALIKSLMKFPDIIKESCSQLKPHILAQYSLVLAHRFNDFYQSCRCIEEPCSELKNSRLILVESFRQVLENSLVLLGMTALEEM